MSRSTAVLAGLILAAVVSTRWLRVNVSASVPLGLYGLRPVPAQLARGDLVLLDVPASMWPWHSRFLPLLKPISGVPGDQVCNRDGVLWIDAVSYGPVLQTAHGRPLPQLQGCLVVQAGEVFLASPIAHSLDSRYFSPVPLAAIRAVAVPLVTWR